MQSPAFARRTRGSILTPGLSTPLLSRSSDRTYMTPSNVLMFPGLADVLGILRLLKTSSPGDCAWPESAFCAVTAVMLNTRFCEAGRLAGHVAYETLLVGTIRLFGSSARLVAFTVGSYERKRPQSPWAIPVSSKLGL